VGHAAKSFELGRPHPHSVKNHLEHACQIAPDIFISKAQNQISLTPQRIIAIPVARRIVRVAINLNDQCAIPTNEVADEAMDHDLMAEFEAI